MVPFWVLSRMPAGQEGDHALLVLAAVIRLGALRADAISLLNKKLSSGGFILPENLVQNNTAGGNPKLLKP